MLVEYEGGGVWEWAYCAGNLLPNGVRVMSGLAFECAVVHPKVDRQGNAGDTSLVDLGMSAPVFRRVFRT